MSPSDGPAPFPWLTINWSGIPKALQDHPRWALWRSVPKAGDEKPGKLPWQVYLDAPAKSNDPATWVSFGDVYAARKMGAGILYALGDGIAGVDLDDCRDPETGVLASWAHDLINTFASYTETSPSATGVKILIRGSLGTGFNHHVDGHRVEAYGAGRFFALTGRRIEGTPETIEARQSQLDALGGLAGAVRPVPGAPGTTIPTGMRNTTLTARGGLMRRIGMTEPEILGALRETNRLCDPPLPEREVAAIAHSVLRYDPDPAEAREPIRFRTAAELATTTPEVPDWIAPYYFARGVLTEVSALPKRGKTTLVLAMVRSVLHRRPFLDTPTTYTPVVVLTEERDPTFREALGRLGLLDRTDLTFLCHHACRNLSWLGKVDLVRAEVARTGAGLVIVDGLAKLAGFKDDDENSSGKADEALEPLQQLAHDTGVAGVVIRHERKSGGQVGQAGRGSNAFTGGADIVLQLALPEGHHRPTERVLNAIGRFDATPPRLVIDRNAVFCSTPMTEVWTESFYRVLGTEAAVEAARAATALLTDLPTVEDEAIAITDFLKAHPDISRSVLTRAIENNPAIQKTGSGKKKDPHRYFRTVGVAYQTSNPSGEEKQHPEMGGVA